jgi:predicted enzyme related to lactoylglutathione lyase
MSHVTQNQPDGTPTWIDLGIPDLERAMEFYGALFGWEFEVGPEEYGHYTMCLLDGRRAAGLMPTPEPAATEVVGGPFDIPEQGRGALLRDAVGAQFGLWQGSGHIGCEVVNEPGALIRNDLVTPTPGPARDFYSAVFGFRLDRNEDMPEADFTFLRREDGHEIGGIFGNPAAPRSTWNTVFEVADTDAVVRRANETGGKGAAPTDMLYGRLAMLTDPFGTEFSVITRPGR